ncbi:MAG TPA: hypothetical protein VLA89_16105 [Gemmatimonadales bacterium]|nr:hypothetical protein [Gemmatimonadales bacterium]
MRLRKPLPPIDLSAIDPGVRVVVEQLRRVGFDTTDSGDGHSKAPGPDVLPYAHVFITIAFSNGNDILDEMHNLNRLVRATYPEASVQLTYDPADRTAIALVSWPGPLISAPVPLSNREPAAPPAVRAALPRDHYIREALEDMAQQPAVRQGGGRDCNCDLSDHVPDHDEYCEKQPHPSTGGELRCDVCAAFAPEHMTRNCKGKHVPTTTIPIGSTGRETK